MSDGDAAWRAVEERDFGPAKRAFDVIFSAAALALTAPVLLGAMAAIRLTTGDPPLYRARRAGRGGRPFSMLKLRSMVTTADQGASITVGQDARITRIGRIIRLTKVDELPQFINVLKGEMSVVGPRPESWDIVQRYYTDDDLQLLSVPPGIVCGGQLVYYVEQGDQTPPAGADADAWYAAEQLPDKLAADMHYVKHRTFAYDLTLIAQTVYIIACIVVGARPRWTPRCDDDFDRTPRAARGAAA